MEAVLRSNKSSYEKRLLYSIA